MTTDIQYPVWVPVFRAGKHTDMAGQTRTWTHADLDGIVSSYDPARHEAPIVIGHPKTNAPAFGWVEGLKREGNLLYAGIKDLDPDFLHSVRAGRYRKRSISLNPDLTLRHIGFLGAMPPAVKGLPDVHFMDGDNPAHTIENDPEKEKSMSFMQKLRDLLKSEGMDVTDIPEPKSFSEGEVADLVAQAVSKATEDLTKAFEAKEQAFAESQAAQAAELQAKADAIAQKEAGLRQAEIQSFCEGLVKDGKLTPAMLSHGMGLPSFLSTLDVHTAHEFGEGATQTPRQFMETFLQALPKAIEFGEVAKRQDDPGNIKAGQLVQNYMETNKTTYRDAVIAVASEHPDLFTE